MKKLAKNTLTALLGLALVGILVGYFGVTFILAMGDPL